MSRTDRIRIACLAAFAAVAVWLGLGAGGFVMIDQGDYLRTAKSLVLQPERPLDLPHSQPVSQRWVLAPVKDWKLRLYRGSATPVIALAALPARRGDGVFDTRHMALAYSVLVAFAFLLIVRRLGAGIALPHPHAARQAADCAAIVAAVPALALVLAAHNAAILGSFYSEIALIVALPFVVLGMLMPPDRRVNLLLFAATATAAMSKAPFFYLPVLVGAALWWSDRVARVTTPGATPAEGRRRGSWIALALAQLLAVIVLVRGDFKAMNAHHATFLGSDYGLTPTELQRAGLEARFHDCVGVDFWGNRVAAPGSVTVDAAPAHCRNLPERKFSQALGTWVRHPDHLIALALTSLPVHARADYFHLAASARYRHRVGGGAATDVLEAASRLRDMPLGGYGFPLVGMVLLAAAVMPSGRRLGAARGVIAMLAAFACSQVVVSLVGEGVRDLGKHLAAGQYALDLAIAMLAVMAVAHLATTITRRRSAA